MPFEAGLKGERWANDRTIRTFEHQNSDINSLDFKKNPEKFVPAHGGFCTFGVSVGKKFDGDPRYADIRNGKLYLFLNEEIFRMYQKDKDGTISKANAQWQKIEHTAATDL